MTGVAAGLAARFRRAVMQGRSVEPKRFHAAFTALASNWVMTHLLKHPPIRIGSPVEALYARLTFAGGFLLLVLTVAYYGSIQTASFATPPIDFYGFALGRDFLNNWMAGRSAFSGGPAPWFDFATYNAALKTITGDPALHDYHWSYPPHLVLLLWPLGLMPYLLAYFAWCAGGLALCVFAAASAGVERKTLLFLAVAPAVTVNLLGGQNGFLTAALLIGGLANLDRRPVLAGMLFGILTIKPQLGLLLPVLLIVTARWRVIVAAVATTVVLAAATAIWFGVDVWADYFREVMPYQQAVIAEAGTAAWAAVGTPFVDARRIGLPVDAAWLVQIAVGCGSVAAVTWTFWHKRDPMLGQALFVTATFLATPYMFNYDMVALAIVVALLRQRPDNTWTDHALIAGVWLLPLAMLPPGLVGIPIASPLLAALAVRLVWRLRTQTAETPNAVTVAPIAGAPPAATVNLVPG